MATLIAKAPEPKDFGLGVLYRYEEEFLWGFEGEGNGIRLRLREYPITKKTDRGCWIKLTFLPPKFVLNPARGGGKRYALPTKDEALTSYLARKVRQIAIHEAQLDRAREGMRLALLLPQPTTNDETRG